MKEIIITITEDDSNQIYVSMGGKGGFSGSEVINILKQTIEGLQIKIDEHSNNKMKQYENPNI